MPGIPDPLPPVETDSEESTGSKSDSEAESESEEMNVDGGDSEEDEESVSAIINREDLSAEERILKIGAVLLEGEEEWEKLKLESLEIYLRQLELRKLQTKLVLDALKAKGSGGQ